MCPLFLISRPLKYKLGLQFPAAAQNIAWTPWPLTTCWVNEWSDDIKEMQSPQWMVHELSLSSSSLLVPLCSSVIGRPMTQGSCVQAVSQSVLCILLLLVWLQHHLLPTNAFANYPKAAPFCTYLISRAEQDSLGNDINLWNLGRHLVNLKWRACLAPGGWCRHVPKFCLGWWIWGSMSILTFP